MSRVLYVICVILGWTFAVSAQDSMAKLIVGQQLIVRSDVNPRLQPYAWSDSEGIWDFSSLTYDINKTYNIKDARNGTAIPVIGQADVVLESGSLEYYYSYDGQHLLLKGTTDVELLYNKDMHHHVLKLDGLLEYDVDFFRDGIVRSTTMGRVELYSDDLPQEIVSSWDELNYRYVLERNIDQKVTRGSKGTLILSDGSFLVTQIIVEREINQYILAKDVEYAQQDVLIESALSTNLFEKEIRYYVDGQILPLLKMTIDPITDDILNVQWASFNSSSSPSRYSSEKEGMKIQPNPTFGKSDLYVHVNRPGIYMIYVKNILGQSIYEEEISVDRALNVPVNLMFLRKGSYFCSLADDTGRTIVTKKLIILKP